MKVLVVGSSVIDLFLKVEEKEFYQLKDNKISFNLGDKIPQNILLEDEQLLMYYDIAKDRM